MSRHFTFQFLPSYHAKTVSVEATYQITTISAFHREYRIEEKTAARTDMPATIYLLYTLLLRLYGNTVVTAIDFTWQVAGKALVKRKSASIDVVFCKTGSK